MIIMKCARSRSETRIGIEGSQRAIRWRLASRPASAASPTYVGLRSSYTRTDGSRWRRRRHYGRRHERRFPFCSRQGRVTSTRTSGWTVR